MRQEKGRGEGRKAACAGAAINSLPVSHGRISSDLRDVGMKRSRSRCSSNGIAYLRETLASSLNLADIDGAVGAALLRILAEFISQLTERIVMKEKIT